MLRSESTFLGVFCFRSDIEGGLVCTENKAAVWIGYLRHLGKGQVLLPDQGRVIARQVALPVIANVSLGR